MLSTLTHYIRKDWSAINTSIKFMGLVMAVKYIGIGLFDPFLSLYFKSLVSDYTAVGAFFSILGLSSLISLIPLMRLADHIKNKLVVWHGMQIYAIASFLYFAAGIFHRISILVIGLILHGIAMSMTDGGSEAYIRRHSHDTSRSLGYLYSAMTAGWVIGMLITAFAIPYYGFHGMFLAAIPFVLLAIVLIPFIRDGGMASFFASMHRYFSHFRDFINIIRDIKLLGNGMNFAWILTFFDGLVLILALSFVPLYAFSIDLSYTEIALLMAVMSFPKVFGFVFSEIADRLNRINLITFGLCLIAVTCALLFLVVGKAPVVILAMVISLGMAIIRPAYSGFMSRFTPKGMLGEISNVRNFIFGAAMMVSPLLFGMIADAFGLRAVFLFTALIAVLLAAFSLFMKRYLS